MQARIVSAAVQLVAVRLCYPRAAPGVRGRLRLRVSTAQLSITSTTDSAASKVRRKELKPLCRCKHLFHAVSELRRRRKILRFHFIRNSPIHIELVPFKPSTRVKRGRTERVNLTSRSTACDASK